MAAGSGISRIKDLESGHQCWPPVPVITGSLNVFVNKKQALRVGDVTSVHVCGNNPPHTDKCVKGSTKVFCNCLLYTSPSPRDYAASRMPSSA